MSYLHINNKYNIKICGSGLVSSVNTTLKFVFNTIKELEPSFKFLIVLVCLYHCAEARSRRQIFIITGWIFHSRTHWWYHFSHSPTVPNCWLDKNLIVFHTSKKTNSISWLYCHETLLLSLLLLIALQQKRAEVFPYWYHSVAYMSKVHCSFLFWFDFLLGRPDVNGMHSNVSTEQLPVYIE